MIIIHVLTHRVHRRVSVTSLSIYIVHNRCIAAFITAQLQENHFGMWIGLFDNDYNDVWRWVDNSPRHYDNWAPGEPYYVSLAIDRYIHLGVMNIWA